MTDQNQRSSLLSKIAAYTEILAKDPKSTIFVSLGETYRKMGMLDEGKKIIEDGMIHHPEFSPAFIVLGRIQCQFGEYQSSDASFAKALELDSDSLAALVGHARLNILLGNEQKARELLLHARSLSPADPVINKLLLSLPVDPKAETVGDEDSIEMEEQSTVGESPLASATLAELYLKQGLENQALDIYRQLSVSDPNNLVLRRQIRDLEEQLTGGLETENTQPSLLPAEEKDDFPDDKETSLISRKEGSSETEGERQGVQSSAVSDSEPDPVQEHNLVLNKFNRWLDNIQQRRSDV